MLASTDSFSCIGPGDVANTLHLEAIINSYGFNRTSTHTKGERKINTKLLCSCHFQVSEASCRQQKYGDIADQARRERDNHMKIVRQARSLNRIGVGKV